MNKDEILAMEEGEELDALVAEKVMGWHIVEERGRKHWNDSDNRYQHSVGKDCEWDSEMLHLIDWHPSSSILWAWEVIEKLQEIKPILNYDPYSKKWYMRFNGGNSYSAETAPLAICRTSLIVAMENE